MSVRVFVLQRDGSGGGRLSSRWIFETVVRHARRADIAAKLTPHGLRRTFNDLARRVADAHKVRAITGHTEEMFEHYSVIDASEKQAVQAAVIRLS